MEGSPMRISFRRPAASAGRSRTTRTRLGLEALEAREVPAAFTVNNPGDIIDPNPSITTLREALTIADSNGEDDIITFDPAVTNIIIGASALPDYTEGKALALIGNGANVLTVASISGGQGVFFVNPTSIGTSFSVSGMTISHVGIGNAIAVGIGSGTTVSVSNVEIIGSGGIGVGIGLANVSINSCTISGEPEGASIAIGGPPLPSTHSTTALNTASAGGGVPGRGGRTTPPGTHTPH